MRHALRGTLVLIAAAIAAGLVTPTPASASFPVNWNVVGAYATGVYFPDNPPAGANNWSCKPAAAHPYPTILVHGTLENQNDTWQALAPTLANDGICVFTFTYGQTWYSGGLGGIGDIYASSQQLGAFVGQVLHATGAAQVDLVGHSQGGMLPRVYLKYDGGIPYVHRLVALAPDNNLPGLSGLSNIVGLIPGASWVIGFGCPACSEQLSQSDYSQLNAGAETYPTVLYTVIASTRDEAATPYNTASFLSDAPNVTNETVQATCPSDPVGHLGLPYDPDAVQMVVNALDPIHATQVTCSAGFGL